MHEDEPMTQAGAGSVDDRTRFRLPAERVAADVVEGEVVIVNLETGSYYTTDGAGCDAWQLLAAGVAVGDAKDVLRRRYLDDGTIDSYVDAIVAFVRDSGLLVDAGDDAPTVDAGAVELGPPAGPVASGSAGGDGGLVPFVPSDFIDYDDMRGLLLLDPVHDVDERGWPHAASGR